MQPVSTTASAEINNNVAGRARVIWPNAADEPPDLAGLWIEQLQRRVHVPLPHLVWVVGLNPVKDDRRLG